MKFHLFFLAAIFTLVASQQVAVPADLAQSFSASGTEGLQVSFGGDASEGITNGQTVSIDDIRSPPTFALGDSSGVNRAISYTIIMLDTTDDNARKIQFLQTGFRATGDKTRLEATGEPVVPYKPPSVASGPRQFSFLLYRQRGEELVQLSGVPSDGTGSTGSFDLKAFEAANNLQSPRVGMAIRVAGNAGEPGQTPPSSASAPVSVPAGTQATDSSISTPPFISSSGASALPSNTASTTDNTAAGSSPFPFTFTFNSATLSSQSLSLATLDSQSSSEPSLTRPASTTPYSLSDSQSTSPSASDSPRPSTRNPRTSTVVITANPTSTPANSSGELAGADAEVDSGNSAAGGLYASSYIAMLVTAVMLLAQISWHILML
ncbi:hypothetical protein GX51_01728 [Blastomyces parvus]|uniref:Uncharacterized protein n=1 Tax=Blastomyces parvus TaxID=2060905 RepID=A0A2B7XET4_9EURO|nr:hypothetical protein GX51_01728 [Blastomyces parvus]